MMTDEKIQIGILGAGGYGTTACRYLTQTGRYAIVACMDIDPKAAQTAAARYRARIYSDLDVFLAHPGLEAVSINTPVPLHHAHLRRCLEADKHVFITKPVTALPEDAEQLADLAVAGNRAFMVGQHARHMVLNRFIRDLIHQGRLGRVCNVMVTSCSGMGLCQTEGTWRTDPQYSPGGPLLQCGIHTIDNLMSLFGPVTRVLAMMQDDVTAFDVVDNTLTLMQFASGVQAGLVCNYTTGYMHTMDFFGTEANLHVREHVTDLNVREAYYQPRRLDIFEPWEPLAIPRDSDDFESYDGVLEKQFAEQIRTGRLDYGNLVDSINALRVVHAAVQSHQTGAAVEVQCQSISASGKNHE